MCGTSGAKGVFWGEGSKGQNGACGNETVDSQHGTGELEVLIPAQRTTTTSKRFSLVITKHILNTVECAVKMLVQLIYFLFCTLKINHVMGVTKYIHLFLDPVAWLQTLVSFYDDMSPFLFKSINML